MEKSSLHEAKSRSLGDVSNGALRILSVFKCKAINGFMRWRIHNKLRLMETASKRRMNKAEQKDAAHLPYDLKDAFVDKKYFFMMCLYSRYTYIYMPR